MQKGYYSAVLPRSKLGFHYQKGKWVCFGIFKPGRGRQWHLVHGFPCIYECVGDGKFSVKPAIRRRLSVGSRGRFIGYVSILRFG